MQSQIDRLRQQSKQQPESLTATSPRHDPSPAVLAAAPNVEATTPPKEDIPIASANTDPASTATSPPAPLAGAATAHGPENATDPAADTLTAGPRKRRRTGKLYHLSMFCIVSLCRFVKGCHDGGNHIKELRVCCLLML